ncbi:MAG: hypothetical protein R3C68_00800 [Myxococcota bacterium]
MRKLNLAALLLSSLFVSSTALAQLDPALSFNTASIDYSLLSRPLTLKGGMLEVDARLQHVEIGPFDATGLVAGIGFGVTDSVELGISTGFLINPDFEWNDTLAMRAAISILASDGVDIAPSVYVPLNLGDGDTLPLVGIGVDTRIKMTNSLALFVGHNALTLGTGDDHADLNLNIGLGIQANDSIAFRLDTQIASIDLGDSNDETLIFGEEIGPDARFIPFGANVLLNVADSVDVFAGLSFPDLTNPGDVFFITGGALLRM